MWKVLLATLLSLVAAGPTPGQVAYDCSAEEGVTKPVLKFTNVSSDPPIVTKGSGQVVYKTILSSANHTINKINTQLHQYYSWKETGPWFTFLKINVNECKENPTLCPLVPGKAVSLVSQHPKLIALTPYGWYRSRQVYSDGDTSETLGCIDMHFRYESKANATMPSISDVMV